jgi:hypothetical protein
MAQPPTMKRFTLNLKSNFTTKAFMPRMGYEGREERQKKELVLVFPSCSSCLRGERLCLFQLILSITRPPSFNVHWLHTAGQEAGRRHDP